MSVVTILSLCLAAAFVLVVIAFLVHLDRVDQFIKREQEVREFRRTGE